MTNLTKYVDMQNGWGAMCGSEPMDLSKLDNALAQKLYNMLEGDLSPENLCCDGELPPAQVRKKARMLNGAVAELNALGYKQAPITY